MSVVGATESVSASSFSRVLGRLPYSISSFSRPVSRDTSTAQ